MKKKSTLVIAYLYSFFSMVLLFSSGVQAQTADPQDIKNSLNNFADPTGIEQVDLTEAAGSAVEAVYSVMGILFFVLAVYAGITWMTAQGKEDQITKARNILVGATIGLTLVVGAYGITTFISERAIDPIATGGGAGTLDEGAGSEGNLETSPEGCCVYRTSRTLREYVGFITTASTCETEANEVAADNDRGDGSNNDHDWQFYSEVQSVEQCFQLESCWDIRNTEERMTCMSTTLTDA